MLNLERLLAWVEDIETTDEQQIKSYLHTDEGFCCLGRLCEVAGLDSEIIDVHSPNRYFSYGEGMTSNSVMPPPEAYDWLGIEEDERVFGETFDLGKYATMNDEGKTFKEIGAQIREDFGLPSTSNE